MDKRPDFKTLLYVTARLYSADTAVTNSWNPVTQSYIPIVIIEERNSGTYILYGINRKKIAVNFRITLNSWFSKMSNHFGNLKNSDSLQNVGLSFPPDGSIETFRETIADIKKQLLTIPSLRKNLKPISIAVAKYSYAPVASIVEVALIKENFPTVEQPKDDTDWIQMQVANGNFLPQSTVPQSTVPANQTKIGNKLATTRKPIPHSRPSFAVSKRGLGFSEGNRGTRKALQAVAATIKNRAIVERTTIADPVEQLYRENFMMGPRTKPNENKYNKTELNKGRAQAIAWQKHLASKLDNKEVKGNKIQPERFVLQRSLHGDHKKENDLQQLRNENGIGDYVRALQALQQEHEDLEVKIAKLKKERQDMQQNIFNLSNGLSSYVTGLIQTDQVPFQNLDKNLFGLTDDTADQPRDDQHPDPVGMAAEKLRARRTELEERAACIASQLKFHRKAIPEWKR